MLKKIKIFLALLIVMNLNVRAQTTPEKSYQKLRQVWLAYNNQTRISRHWGGWLDLHLRTKDDFFDSLSQTIIRPGISYFFNDGNRITAGYAYVSIYPGDNHRNIARPEHRAWQQFQWFNKYSRLRTMQWVRLEERFRRKVLNDSTLAQGHNFNYRLRYNVLLQIPIRGSAPAKGGLSFILNDEVHINFGKEVSNYFDQNRFFAGFAWHVSATDNIQFGYMNQFQQLGGANRYRSVQIARLYYFHNLDLRNTK
ncbi:MAG TPA: DUF2490 domain-containing protein [Flavisolibacter sp.]|nr:DUF2490 domain-containing protein [Flavisolibacter sp.]